jgi:hypothetical protein
MGIPEFEAELYDGAVEGGSVLLSVNCNAVDQVHNAKSSLERTGARDVAYTSDAISKDISDNDSVGGSVLDGDELRELRSLAERPS